MQDAMVAVEDRRFRYHPGVDPVGMARAAVLAVQNYGTGRRMQGASTITQQLARNIFLSNSYTWARKMREMVLSLALEWKFSKDEILVLYLNKVYFGGEIGRESCRDRVCQYVYISVVAVSVKNKVDNVKTDECSG